jgi:hypothetical protein
MLLDINGVGTSKLRTAEGDKIFFFTKHFKTIPTTTTCFNTHLKDLDQQGTA